MPKKLSMGLGICVVAGAAMLMAIPLEPASGHTKKFKTKVSFVPASEPGSHAIRVRSRNRGCRRNRHVTWYRRDEGRDVIVYAEKTNRLGIAEPRSPFPAQAGDYVVAGRKILRSNAAHTHVCRRARRTFVGG